MKRIMCLLLPMMLLCACSRSDEAFDKAMSLRSGLINAAGCHFVAEITADYADKTYSFTLSCEATAEGDICFAVLQPQYIAGIRGTISSKGGNLVFDDTALAFELQADGLLSPVSAPWVVITALRSGYIRSCVQEGNLFRMSINDSYQEDALMLDVWFDRGNIPLQADIYENNRRILTVIIKNYVLL